MDNLKKEKIYNLLRTNILIPCLFFFFILIFIFEGFSRMEFAPCVIFSVASLGMISLLYDSCKIYQGTYKG